VAQRTGRVIRDGRYADASRLEIGNFCPQLDQLGFAVRSPVGRTDESKHQPVRTLQIRERTRSALLIGQAKAGDCLTHAGASFHILPGVWNGTQARLILRGEMTSREKAHG
jgi:hypothetical protein